MLKGVHERPEVALVRLREIKYKIERKNSAQDRSRNIIAVKDVVKVLDGPSKVRLSVQSCKFKVMFILPRYLYFFLCAGEARTC